MSGSSENGGRILYDAATIGANHKPVGSVASRYVVANNINHYADIHAQQRVNFSGLSTKSNSVISTSETEALVQVFASGPFPIALREDGSSYRIRVSVGTAIANAASTGYVAVVLAPVDTSREALLDALAAPDDPASDAVWYTTWTGSTSAAYRTGASLGPSAWTRMVGLSSGLVSEYTRPVAGLTDIGGDPTQREACMVSVSVFMKTSNASHAVKLYALNAAEWYG